jgi:hypothetical protein
VLLFGCDRPIDETVERRFACRPVNLIELEQRRPMLGKIEQDLDLRVAVEMGEGGDEQVLRDDPILVTCPTRLLGMREFAGTPHHRRHNVRFDQDIGAAQPLDGERRDSAWPRQQIERYRAME